MAIRVSASEVTEFRTAVAGVEIDWVRTDQGWGAATMVSSGDEHAAVSNGGLDFSTVLHTDLPDDRIGLQMVTRAPPGMSWCGSEAHDGELRLYRPTTSVFGTVPAGSRAITLVAWIEPLVEIADDLGLGELRAPAGVDALPRTAAIRALADDLMQIGAAPELLEAKSGTRRLLEATARAIASIDELERTAPGRGFDSRQIVAACLEYAQETGEHQPTISELCRVAYASESRLRQAFVEVVGVPPIQYFQTRVLSKLREELVTATPAGTTVTHAATSLGLTQLGRVAGRYRALFGETPSETLRRVHARRF